MTDEVQKMSTTEALENLITKLKELDAREDVESVWEGNDRWVQNVDEIDGLACIALITEGQTISENRVILKEAGYMTFAVEQDSFGWLIGGIATRHGIVTFG